MLLCSGRREASAALTAADSLPGNKVDRDDREIPEDVGAEFSQRHGMYFLETSAKASDNVEKLFGDIANELLQVNRGKKSYFLPIISLLFVLEKNLFKIGATEKAPWFQIADLTIHAHFFNYLRMPFFPAIPFSRAPPLGHRGRRPLLPGRPRRPHWGLDGGGGTEVLRRGGGRSTGGRGKEGAIVIIIKIKILLGKK